MDALVLLSLRETPAAVMPELAKASGATRQDLRRALESVRERFGDIASEEARREVIEILRAHRAVGLEAAWERLRRHPARGCACAAAISALHDDMLRELHRLLSRSNPAPDLCLAAVGGYGRGMLAPGSDVDLLFLHAEELTPQEKALVSSMLRILWDVGLMVGHSTRTIAASLQAAAEDASIRTTLLEARFLAGDRVRFRELETRFQARVGASGCANFIDAKLSERDQRHRRFGASRYLVEPNIKESKGGLRDLDALFWMAKYACRLQRLGDMVALGLLTRAEYAQLRASWNFLWAVRCELHFWTGRAENRLFFDAQLHIAQAWGYRSRGGLRAVECFMKRYFTMARRNGHLTRILCARLEEQGKKRPPKPLRSAAADASLPAGFAVESGRLNVTDADVFARDGCNFLRVFLLRAAHRAVLHPRLVTLLSQELPRVDAALRRDPEANRLFLECLLATDAAAILREMNEMGVLGRFIPEFGRVVGQMQFGMYHHYTVDEHSLRALEELRLLERGDSQELPLASSLAQSRQRNRAVLSLAVFLHDVAKGRREDHSVAGARLARKIAARLSLSRAEAETAAWLVRNHLLMSDVAQKRDIQDAQTIEDFAAEVGSPERLRLLLLLTVADIRAVGPGVWNGWKGSLLRRLYHAASARLTGHSVSESLRESARHAQETLAQRLRHWSPERLAKHMERFPPEYWSAFDATEQERHALMLARAEGMPPAERLDACLQITPDAFRSATEMLCWQRNRPGLFSAITGVCARANVSIVSARILTTRDGMALESLRLREEDGGALLDSHRIEALRADLIETLSAKGTGRRGAGRSRSLRRRNPFALRGEVWLDNKASRQRSVLEVSGLDRPGLLHRLARALFSLGVEVNSAHVATFGERVCDVLYVRERDGGKIKGEARQRQVREELLRVLNP